MKHNFILAIVFLLALLFVLSLPSGAQKPAKKHQTRIREVIISQIIEREGSKRVYFIGTDETGATCHVKYYGLKSPLIALGGKVEIVEKSGKDYRTWNVAKIKPILD